MGRPDRFLVVEEGRDKLYDPRNTGGPPTRTMSLTPDLSIFEPRGWLGGQSNEDSKKLMTKEVKKRVDALM